MFLLGMAVQHLLLTKLTISGSHEGPLLVTLGLSLLIGNALLMTFGGRPKTVGTPFAGSVQVFGAVVSYSRLLAFVGAVVVALALTLVLSAYVPRALHPRRGRQLPGRPARRA